MGCWNETCGITQMSITYGDQARLFLLVKNKGDYHDSGIIHYTTDLWRPFGLPILGTYDDYGGLEKVEEDIFSNLLLESLKEMLIEVPNRMGEEISKKNLTWESAINRLTDEGIKVADPFDIVHLENKINEQYKLILESFKDVPTDKWSPELSEIARKKKDFIAKQPAITNMYHMMVHEDVYQAILKMDIRDRWGYGDDLKKSLYAGAAEYIKNYREILPSKKQEEAAIEAGDIKLYSKLNVKRRMDREMLGVNNSFVGAFNHLDGSMSSGHYLKKYAEFIEKKIEEGAPDNDPEIEGLTHQLVGFIQFSRAMSFLRKQWIPQTGKGGQDDEYDLHESLAKVIIQVADKKRKRYEE